jgi:hypothetical protein
MSDEFGTIIVGGKFSGDLPAIVDVLNTLEFGDIVEFITTDDGYICVSNWCIQCPMAIPQRVILTFRDGRRIPRDEADKQQIKAWEEEEGDLDWEECDSEWLSKKVSHLITSGALEIVAVGHEAAKHAYFHRLVIRSNGLVEMYREFFEASPAQRE